VESSKLIALLLAALVSTMLVAANTNQVNPQKGLPEKIEQSLIGSKRAVDSKQAADPNQKVPLILQTNSANCGLASLAMLLSYYSGTPVSLASLERTATILLSASSKRWRAEGYSVGELQSLASAYGMPIRAARIGAAELKSLTFPLLAWIDFGSTGHFTVVQSFQDGEVSLADPTRGYLRLGKAMWDRLWLKGDTGIVLFVD
jgi:ABC-type bacteriocin/lantibiotic exporter with double-glycine peptidase domain